MKFLILVPLLASALVIATVSMAPAQIWSWVDQDGRLTFSNIKPSAAARDITVVVQNADEDPDKAAARSENHWSSEDLMPSWHYAPQSYPESYSEKRIAEDQAPYEDQSAVCEYDCWYLSGYPRLVSYTPYEDYAYSRRHCKKPRRHFLKSWHSLPDRHQDHFGYRRYDRHYYSSSYRYRSRLPRYAVNLNKRPFDAHRARPHENAYSRSHYYRGFENRAGHRQSYRGRSGVALHR